MNFRYLSILMISLMIILSGCSSSSDVAEVKKKEDKLKLSSVLMGDSKDNGDISLYTICNKKTTFNITISRLMQLKYDKNYGVTGQLNFIEKGNNLIENQLIVSKNDKDKVIEGLYSIIDFGISPKGKYVAYRGFKEDRLESIDNLKILDLTEDKSIKINSKVIISGSLYGFKDEDTLFYYGVSEETNKSALYEYNIKTNKEQILYDINLGYITYVKALDGNKLIILEDKINSSELSLFYPDTKTKEVISSNITSVYSSININGEVYFIASDKSESKALYRYVDKKLKRLTYDFPKHIYDKSNLGVDEEGNLYFIGYDEDENKRNIFSVGKDGSINLISNEEGKYILYENISY